jgi:hypothetical protein
MSPVVLELTGTAGLFRLSSQLAAVFQFPSVVFQVYGDCADAGTASPRKAAAVSQNRYVMVSLAW